MIEQARPLLLITGAGGMVGRNLLNHPGIAAWRVLAPSSRDLDLRDKSATQAYLDHHHPDAVVHAAGLVGGIQANLAQPVRFLTANAEMGLNLLQACLVAGVDRVINLASSCMYPHDLGEGLAEDMILTGPLEPSNEGYALAKIMVMQLCKYAMQENSARAYKTLIPCNLYGKWDKFDPGRSHLIPAIIHKVHEARVQGLDQVEIWGDGNARREFMYAGDLAEAIVRALADLTSLPDTPNIGPGHDHTINDYYATVARVIGWQGEFTHDLDRPVGMNRKLLDVSRQKAWGWSPSTSLEDGIRSTYQFYQEAYE